MHVRSSFHRRYSGGGGKADKSQQGKVIPGAARKNVFSSSYAVASTTAAGKMQPGKAPGEAVMERTSGGNQPAASTSVKVFHLSIPVTMLFSLLSFPLLSSTYLPILSLLHTLLSLSHRTVRYLLYPSFFRRPHLDRLRGVERRLRDRDRQMVWREMLFQRVCTCICIYTALYFAIQITCKGMDLHV